MEATSVETLPLGPEWQYEPKWDGFRCLAFRRGADVYLQSKSRPLARYFPEVVEAMLNLAPDRFVLDGELVIPSGGQLSFDDLLLRLHPAESRVRKLAAEIPASYIAFDLLETEGGESLVDEPLFVRREALEAFASRYFTGAIYLSPATHDPAAADEWFRTSGGGLDGIMAKLVDAPYTSGERIAMRKIKHMRTAECVVGGFRYGSGGERTTVASLLLGLYDDDGKLHHVGFTSAMNASMKRALTPELEALIEPPGFTGRAPGGPSRWSTGRSADWQPLRNVLVVEVQYDHFSGGRFRHGTAFLRWRPDKPAASCTLDQVGPARGSALALL
jgi:ATP-dependent DNA ligase